jgi:adenosylmethionine-8-amino-7-oxononanoate aminotransferase
MHDFPLWLGYTDMPSFLNNPIIIVSAHDSILVDNQGHEYVDLNSGMKNVILGYSQPRIVDAVNAQMQKVSFVNGSSFANESALQLAKDLAALCQVANPRILFHNSGTEAVEAAIKIVRQLAFEQANQKYSIVTLRRGYHGQTLGALSASGEEYSKEPFGPLVEGFIPIRIPSGSNDLEDLNYILDTIETVGAVMIEPVLANGGVITLPMDFLSTLAKICKERGILLICDEITTGFGRCGEWFVSNLISPDILLVGKAMTNGYLPLSATIVSERIWKAIDNRAPFRHGQTNLNHPVCCACGQETISILKEIDAPSRARQKGKMILDALSPLANRGLIVSIRANGLLFALDFAQSFSNGKNSRKWLQDFLLQQGFVVGQIDNTIFLSPPLVITVEQIARFATTLKKALTPDD